MDKREKVFNHIAFPSSKREKREKGEETIGGGGKIAEKRVEKRKGEEKRTTK